MDTLQINRRHIADLAAKAADPAVSIYIPTSRTGTEVMQGRIRLKNLLTEAEERLVARGMRRTLAKDLLAEAAKLVDDPDFWNDRLDSVAFFVGPGVFEVFHLPLAAPEHLEVGTHFNVRPLLPVLSLCPNYYVLALELNHVRLVRCGPWGATFEDVPDMPESIDAFLSVDHIEKQYQFYTAGPAGRAGSVRGHGAGDKGADHKEQVQRFAHAIDHSLIAHLRDSADPVVLIATQEIQDAYRASTKLSHLLPEGVICSPKTLDLEELRGVARPSVDAYADVERRAAIDRYRQLVGTGLTSQQIEEILPAALQGRVDILLAYEGSEIWGKFDSASGVAIVDEEPVEGDEELINEAAIATIENGGSVFAVQRGELALTGSSATIFRY